MDFPDLWTPAQVRDATLSGALVACNVTSHHLRRDGLRRHPHHRRLAVDGAPLERRGRVALQVALQLVDVVLGDAALRRLGDDAQRPL